jgi:hypothetical protein
MNFKFTKVKTIVSTLISLIPAIYFFMQSGIYDGSPSALEVISVNLTGFMFGFLIAFVPIYLIWSLFDKKEDESSLGIIGIIIGVLFLLAIILSFAGKFF